MTPNGFELSTDELRTSNNLMRLTEMLEIVMFDNI